MINFVGFAILFALAAAFGILVLGVWIWAIVDCISSNRKPVDKLIWMIIILAFNIIGAVIYLIARDSVKIDKNEKKQLKKSAHDKVIFGVCGGIAEYFNTDVTIIRLVLVLVTLFSAGTGILLYLIAAVIIPGGEKTKKEGANPLMIVAVSVAAVAIVLILCGTFISMIALSQYSHPSFETGIRAVADYEVAEKLARDTIISSSNFREYGGAGLICTAIQESDSCSDYEDPYGITLPQRGCYSVRCKFDSNDPKIEGFTVDAVVAGNRIQEMSFANIPRSPGKELLTESDCRDAGFEVLYPELVGGPVQCDTRDGVINVTSGNVRQICNDLCGDSECQEIVCLGEGCPCAEDATICPEDCK